MEKNIQKVWGSGPINLNGIEIDCAVLEDGTPVLNKGKMMKALGRPWKGSSRTDKPIFIGAINLQSYIRPELEEMLKGVEFYNGGRLATGYDAKILPLICRVYRDAERAGVLTKNQLPTAQICETITDAFATVGITALIYEQLGYEKFKHPEAFRMLVESYLSEEVRKWSKEFPDELFYQMDRIYGNQPTTSRNRPQYYAKFIRKYIYDPLEKGEVLKLLDEKNPKTEKGYRKNRHHQLTSEKIGLPSLRAQVWQVVAALKVSSSKQKYENNFAKMTGQTYQPDLWESL
ncbi:MAG: P63C domain-containing protein [Minisyncoccia bacterium]